MIVEFEGHGDKWWGPWCSMTTVILWTRAGWGNTFPKDEVDRDTTNRDREMASRD
jgi:hypothetical protein